ncbi:MarR family transcriptional regulator [Conexibacter sp. JD483]|uniref:MarR family winged helix-turn-helix transcriptional regulator n=1 Tax=unclassified Conexibacter TaxID=2627773 RepID=UPI00271B1D17|nr:MULTISPECIES: MarR family transcriptional regulator [unclassified Conexibacter]MDO8185581.1 MarR family transcriptional regulator [Conexibacter sp. CPCC 205706]MDO8198754.1 MarR family transcriptional regulator [Conexibacter sp. CPCC 205762]MDR9367896.1 MarR family transcriptional regulator [Conexibacter sp. JD483]
MLPDDLPLGLRFDRLGRIAAARWPQVYGELGIGKPALLVLVTLVREGAPLRQARLAERSGVDRATLVALLNELESRQLAARAPDPADRRAHAVSITDAGRALLLRALELERGDDFFAALTPAELTTLGSLLSRLLAAHGE